MKSIYVWYNIIVWYWIYYIVMRRVLCLVEHLTGEPNKTRVFIYIFYIYMEKRLLQSKSLAPIWWRAVLLVYLTVHWNWLKKNHDVWWKIIFFVTKIIILGYGGKYLNCRNVWFGFNFLCILRKLFGK